MGIKCITLSVYDDPDSVPEQHSLCDHAGNHKNFIVVIKKDHVKE